MIDVAVIGAGPYGLSIASHLRARRIDHRIFGRPMHTWRTQMPQGMFLKSDGFASNLYSSSGELTLREFCAEHGLPYADIGLPIRREVFVDYGEAFQRRLVPDLEPVDVVAVESAGVGFHLDLSNGASLQARRVILSVGISHFAHMPKQLSGLPRALVSHSSERPDLSVFAGREVVVMGAGASALDCAALLVKEGASVRLVARAPVIQFHDGPGKMPRPLMERIHAPWSGLGPGWRSRFCTDAPILFHAMPEKFRLLVVRKHLGPAPGWWTRPMVEGRVDFLLERTVESAREREGRVELNLRAADGGSATVVADHVIAATGYRPSVERLGFLGSTLRQRIRTAADAPVLSRNFESSVPGLYVVGLAAANSFGPMLRFAFGAGFASRRLSRHLASSRHKPVPALLAALPASA